MERGREEEEREKEKGREEEEAKKESEYLDNY